MTKIEKEKWLKKFDLDIVNLKIREDNFTDHITAEEYHLFKTQIKRAFEYQNHYLKALRNFELGKTNYKPEMRRY